MTTTDRVWLIRHGATEWSESGRHTGRTDVPLTPAGEVAARALRAPLSAVEFTTVLTSPLQRARQTCDLAGFSARAVVDDDLAEWDYGNYEGLTTDQIRSDRPDWSLWRDGCPGGENAADVGARADRVIARIQESRCAAVFAHGHLLRVLAARWLAQPPEEGRLYALSTAAVSVLGHEREQRVILRWNDTAHVSG